MLTNLTNELAAMGYETFVFDEEDRLKWEDFSWLCFRDYKFKIAPVDFVFSQAEHDYVIVSSWLKPLLPRLRRRILSISIPNMEVVTHLRYWCQSELLRHSFKDSRRCCLNYLSKIAINNRYLEQYYRSMGFSNIIYLENWVRSDLFRIDDESISKKIPNSIGHQPDGSYQTYCILKSHFGENNVVLCEGNQYEVSEKMKMSDFYVFFNRPSPYIRIFKGEVFGLSLFEAMACGCVCVAIEHEGNKFLRSTIPLVQNISEAIECIKALMDDSLKKEKIRKASLQLVEDRFRFSDDRRKSIVELLA